MDEQKPCKGDHQRSAGDVGDCSRAKVDQIVAVDGGDEAGRPGGDDRR